MKKTVILLLMILYCLSILLIASEKEDFISGCDFYKKAEYEKALEKFKSIETNYPTANLFYNIGNTYFRLGKIGYTLVYYERARKHLSFNDDINFNIKFLADMIKDPDYEQGLFSKINLTLIKFLFSFSVFVFAIFVSLKLFDLQKKMFWPLIVSGLFVVIFSSLYFIKYKQQNQIDAVVISSIAEIRSGPDSSFKVNFTFPEGKKVIVLNRSGEWTEIGVKSLGLRGWLETKNIETI